MSWSRSSTKTRVNASGVIETMANNIPTFDYTNGVCPVIGVEPQRTNNFQRSEDITNVYWTKTGATASANTQTAPNNTLTADSLVATNSTGRHEVSRSVITSGGSSGTKWIASFYAKKGNVDYAYIEGLLPVWQGSCIVDLNNGNVVFQSGTTTNVIVTLINGYYRISLSSVRDGSGTNALVRFGMTSSPTSTSSTLTTSNFTYMWGFQWETSDFNQSFNPTSYIPTTTASVTRISDSVFTTNQDNMLKYVNINDGTLFVKVNFKTYAGIRFYLSLSGIFVSPSQADIVRIQSNSNNQIEGVWGNNIITSGIYSDGILKIAFGFKRNDFVLYINGVLIGTDTSGDTGLTLERINLTPRNETLENFSGNELIYGAIYNQRLSNSDLAELTTL